MKYLPTDTAERVYKLLQNRLGASSDYYEREAFVYHYGVVHGAPVEHRLLCRDGAVRIFHCTKDQKMWVTGEGTDQVNAVLRQIHKELSKPQKIAEFTVVTNEVSSSAD